jgi:hypothetical protein
MFPRLLTLLCVLAMFQRTCLAQHSGADAVPDNCPVTKPWIQVYVPPPPYSPETDPSLFWYRANELWTSLPVNGTWEGLPYYTPADPSFRH